MRLTLRTMALTGLFASAFGALVFAAMPARAGCGGGGSRGGAWGGHTFGRASYGGYSAGRSGCGMAMPGMSMPMNGDGSAVQGAGNASGGTYVNAGTGQPTAAGSYTCSMHPGVVSSTPGSCPYCGMALSRR
jgi:hypothetical protein